jgi:hypothetical protein
MGIPEVAPECRIESPNFLLIYKGLARLSEGARHWQEEKLAQSRCVSGSDPQFFPQKQLKSDETGILAQGNLLASSFNWLK